MFLTCQENLNSNYWTDIPLEPVNVKDISMKQCKELWEGGFHAFCLLIQNGIFKENVKFDFTTSLHAFVFISLYSISLPGIQYCNFWVHTTATCYVNKNSNILTVLHNTPSYLATNRHIKKTYFLHWTMITWYSYKV